MFTVRRQLEKNDKIQFDKVAKPFVNRHNFDNVTKRTDNHQLISTIDQYCFNNHQKSPPTLHNFLLVLEKFS